MKIGNPKARRRPTLDQRLPGKKKALLIGIRYNTSGSLKTDEVAELPGPHRDAHDVQRLLIDTYGYREDDIIMLLDEEGGDPQRQPTKLNITRQIYELVKNAQPGDRFVFLFAGHSTQLTCHDHTEDDSKDEAIVPMDHKGCKYKAMLIMDNWLRRHLVDPLRPGVQLIAILDACHSGTLLGVFSGLLRDTSGFVDRPPEHVADLDHHDCNRLWRPWISKGDREKRTMQERVVRRNDMFPLSSPKVTIRPLPRAAASLDDAMLQLLTRTRPPAEPKPVRSATFTFSRSATTNSLELVRGRLSKAFVKIGGWKDAIQVQIRRCMSPESTSTCNGKCIRPKESEKPHVICLAACGDKQQTWENRRKGNSMTHSLVELLREDPRPKLEHLVKNLYHARYQVSCQVHDAEKHRRAKLKKQPGKILRRLELEAVNFQDIQVGSQERLNMRATFEF